MVLNRWVVNGELMVSCWFHDANECNLLFNPGEMVVSWWLNNGSWKVECYWWLFDGQRMIHPWFCIGYRWSRKLNYKPTNEANNRTQRSWSYWDSLATDNGSWMINYRILTPKPTDINLLNQLQFEAARSIASSLSFTASVATSTWAAGETDGKWWLNIGRWLVHDEG